MILFTPETIRSSFMMSSLPIDGSFLADPPFESWLGKTSKVKV